MTGSAIALALGLLTAPGVGATIAEAFHDLGPDAVFGVGCGDGSSSRAIQAPVRWATSIPARWRMPGVLVMAEIDGRKVTSVHLAAPVLAATDEGLCGQALARLSGQGSIASIWRGPDLVMSTPESFIAGQPTRYRAIYRASRHECRTMLSIGA